MKWLGLLQLLLLVPRLWWQWNQDNGEKVQDHKLNQAELTPICERATPKASSEDLRAAGSKGV
jgi:hypothetical protein